MNPRLAEFLVPLPTPDSLEAIEAENNFAWRFLPPNLKVLRKRTTDRSFDIAEWYHDHADGGYGWYDEPYRDAEIRELERLQELDRATTRTKIAETIAFYVNRGWYDEPIVKACRIALRWS